LRAWAKANDLGNHRRDRDGSSALLDDVAYVRFASVYRNFREPKDFQTALAELNAEDEPKPTASARK
jgi:hypothetical protein